MKDNSTQSKTVSCKWTTTLFLAFCFLLYAQDSRSSSNPQVDSEINTDLLSEEKISD